MPVNQPVLAIVGRPNVGKSTLFNRLVGQRQAVTADAAGTTRDRLYADTEWQGYGLTIIDTGGLLELRRRDQDDDGLQQAVNQHVRDALIEADVVLLVVDGQSGLTAADQAVATEVRRLDKPCIVVVNKVDSPTHQAAVEDFWRLGFSQVQPVSALHGKQTGDLLTAVCALVPKRRPPATRQSTEPVVALLGRPNVGKSTLFNQLTGDRRITSERPQTTRDTASQLAETVDGPIRILDTAGVPRRKHTGRGIPKFSLVRTVRAVHQADVVVLVLDALDGPTVQDAHLTSYSAEAGKALVLAVNKWDLIEKTPDIQEQFFARLHKTLGFLPNPPVVFVSALTGEKLDRLARAIRDVWESSARRVDTATLNRLLAAELHRLPGGRQQPKLLYATQVGIRPPTFVCFVNSTKAWQDNHRRFIENVLREHLGLYGNSIRLQLKAKRPKEAAV